MSAKALLIVNPYSGRKNGAKIASYVSERLQAKNYSCEIFISHSLEELEQFISRTDLAAFALAGIIGGDGTMHEFLNAVFRKSDTMPVPVALFPCGTGNAFNFDIGCSTVDETLECIYSNSVASIDIAEVSYSDRKLWSFNILGCGLVAEINALAEKMRFLRGSRYTVASLIKLLANPVNELVVQTDNGELRGKFSFMLACNTRYTGKGMMMAPKAQLGDGKFDVLLVKACPAWTLLKLFPKIFRGEHLGAAILHYEQTSTLNISSPGKNLVTNIDGEIKGSTPLQFTVHNNRIRAFVAPQ